MSEASAEELIMYRKSQHLGLTVVEHSVPSPCYYWLAFRCTKQVKLSLSALSVLEDSAPAHNADVLVSRVDPVPFSVRRAQLKGA
jgi:hypothetical protein